MEALKTENCSNVFSLETQPMVRVFLFPQSEGIYGIMRSEKAPVWMKDRYHERLMFESEVAEIETAFKDFLESQRKIYRLLGGEPEHDWSLAGNLSDYK